MKSAFSDPTPIKHSYSLIPNFTGNLKDTVKQSAIQRKYKKLHTTIQAFSFLFEHEQSGPEK